MLRAFKMMRPMEKTLADNPEDETRKRSRRDLRNKQTVSIRIEQHRRANGPETIFAGEQHDARERREDSRDAPETQQTNLILLTEHLGRW